MAAKLSAKDLLELAIKVVDMPDFTTDEALLQYARENFGSLKFPELDRVNTLAQMAERFAQAANA